MNGTAPDPRAVDAATLTPLVREALRDDGLEVVDWRSEPFGHSLGEVYGLGESIVRFCGTARRAGQPAPWTLVLKIVTARPGPDEPAAPDNHSREPLVYRSNILAGGAGLAAPRCFGVSDRGDGQCWLWLEEVVDDIGREWPADRYMLAARHLGQFNASHVAGSTVSYPWLSRSPLREALREMAPVVARLSSALDNPFVTDAIPPQSAAALIALPSKTERWLDALDDRPQALCHWDAHRANLFSRLAKDGQVQTVAIDWAGLGWGPLGADLSKLLSQTVNFFGLEPSALPALEAALFDHYLEGLRESGWCGDRRDVRLAYAAAAAVRLIVRTGMALRLVFDERARVAFERATGQSFATAAQGFGTTLPYYLALVDEAGRLV